MLIRKKRSESGGMLGGEYIYIEIITLVVRGSLLYGVSGKYGDVWARPVRKNCEYERR